MFRFANGKEVRTAFGLQRGTKKRQSICEMPNAPCWSSCELTSPYMYGLDVLGCAPYRGVVRHDFKPEFHPGSWQRSGSTAAPIRWLEASADTCIDRDSIWTDWSALFPNARFAPACALGTWSAALQFETRASSCVAGSGA
eukprot:6211376-Pleurochrysis_carterae.AAC.1